MVEANVTVAVGEGALTNTTSESPICMAVVEGLKVPKYAVTVAEAVALALTLSMPITKSVPLVIDKTVAPDGMPGATIKLPTTIELVSAVVTVADPRVVSTLNPLKTPPGPRIVPVTPKVALSEAVTVTSAAALTPTAVPVMVAAPAVVPPATVTIY